MMNNQQFGKKLEKRTLQFGVRVIQLPSTLPNTPEGRVVRNQFIKSGTSVGANYREANRARSKADFIHKMKICETEASEAVFLLKIIEERSWADEHDIRVLIREAGELLGIFTSAGNKLKNKNLK